jgi:hypothetical protein
MWLISKIQLPRVARTSPLRRTPVSSFVRSYADAADEKVKGAVIGIDLGMSTCDVAYLQNFEPRLTIIYRYHQLRCCGDGGKGAKDH